MIGQNAGAGLHWTARRAEMSELPTIRPWRERLVRLCRTSSTSIFVPESYNEPQILLQRVEKCASRRWFGFVSLPCC